MNLRSVSARLRMGLLAIFRRHSFVPAQTSLPEPQTQLLRALLCGDTLKSHRYLEGGKEYRLHPLNGEATRVQAQLVRSLEEKGFLLSNQKFPAATLILTEQGRRAAQEANDAAGASPTSSNLVAIP